MHHQKVTGRARSMPVGLAMGAAVSMGITLGMAVIGAKLIDAGALGEGMIGYIAMVVLLLSSFCCGLVSAGSIKHRTLMVCGISALIYYGILLSMTALFFGGQYQGMGVTALLILCGCAVAAMIVTQQGRGVRGRRRRRTATR